MTDAELNDELAALIASLGGCNQAQGIVARARIEAIHRALAEPAVHNRSVAGSNPAAPTDDSDVDD